ncbi:MAG: nitroreductase family protein [Chloroflexi bacterium]|nr:nitroreductase family protein [Chloroflexota bacterium]MCL5273389.1 nitroreductase family protein [Chloroflexota bacterium]
MKSPGPIGFIRGLLRIISAKPQAPRSLQDNALLNVILRRRSVRSFASRDIPDDVFSAILEAGRVAPSTVNLQSWSFATFSAESWRAKFGHPIPFKARRAIIVLADTHRDRLALGTDAFPHSPLMEYTLAVMNASLAAMAMSIAAEALGVSSVMLSETGRSGMLDMAWLAEQLRLPSGVFALTTIVFGYAHGVYPPMPPRLPMETVSFDGAQGYREPAPGVMQSWLEQMIAGYKASHLTSSFEAQLRIYQNKIEQAEADLHRMIFGDS